jgi:hypothetical protein
MHGDSVHKIASEHLSFVEQIDCLNNLLAVIMLVACVDSGHVLYQDKRIKQA